MAIVDPSAAKPMCYTFLKGPILSVVDNQQNQASGEAEWRAVHPNVFKARK
jgi:hypothetical protein